MGLLIDLLVYKLSFLNFELDRHIPILTLRKERLNLSLVLQRRKLEVVTDVVNQVRKGRSIPIDEYFSFIGHDVLGLVHKETGKLTILDLLQQR
jgi:hypothetical protein